MRDTALAAHRLDQLFGAEIRRIAGVGAKAERRRRRLLKTAGGRNDGSAVFRQFLNRAVGANGIAREHQERVVALTQEALEQRILHAELPFLRNSIVGGAE